MDLNKLRLGLSYIFFESKLAKNTKTQLINFIEHADAHQLKVLAMDGEIVATKKLDESARQIIDDRFNDELVEKLNYAALKGLEELTYLKKVKVVEEGWKLGALIGFLTPIPGGVIAGGLIGHWMDKNKKRVIEYCKRNTSSSSDYNACLAGGNKAMKEKAMQARQKSRK